MGNLGSSKYIDTQFWSGALAGLLATALGYVTYRTWGWLFWPHIAAQWTFALVPGAWQARLVAVFGLDAKILSLYSGMIAQVAAGGVFALLTPNFRWPWRALSVCLVVLFSVLSFQWIAPAVQLPKIVPFVAGTILVGMSYGLGYQVLTGRGSTPRNKTGNGGKKPADRKQRWTRRKMLSTVATVVGSAFLWPWIRSDLLEVTTNSASLQNVTTNTTPSSLIEAIRSGKVEFDKIPLASPWLTPEPQFYYVSKNLVPHKIGLEEWKALKVDGLVEQPFSVTLDELQAMPRVEQYCTLQCIDYNPYNSWTSNLIGNGQWTGVSVRTLLARAQVQPDALDLKLKATDGYSDSISLNTVLEHEEIILAWALNGETLSAKHGYPLRLITPGIFGMKNVKHIQSLVAVNEDYKGYWQRRGWADNAPVNTNAKTETLGRDQVFSRGETVIMAGWAYAGTRGISKIEVSLNNGQIWSEGLLEPIKEPYSWARWAYLWNAKEVGRFSLIVRAVDGLGQPQVEQQSGSFPNGSTGYHRVWADVVEV